MCATKEGAFKLICHHSIFCTLTRYTLKAPNGCPMGGRSNSDFRASSVHILPHLSTASRSVASAAAFPAIGSPPARHLAMELATAAALVAAARASGPHQKNAPLQHTAHPSGAASAIVRPRGRLPCTQACHNQAMPALSKPAPAADERRPHDNLKKAAMTSRQGAGAKQLLSSIGLSSVLHAVATADT